MSYRKIFIGTWMLPSTYCIQIVRRESSVLCLSPNWSLSKEFAQGARQETFLDFDRVQRKNKGFGRKHFVAVIRRHRGKNLRGRQSHIMPSWYTGSVNKCPLLAVALAIAEDVLNLENMSVSQSQFLYSKKSLIGPVLVRETTTTSRRKGASGWTSGITHHSVILEDMSWGLQAGSAPLRSL